MNPHTDQSSSTRKEGTVPTKGLDKSSVKVSKNSHPVGGLNLESYVGTPERIQKMKTPLLAALGVLVVIDFFINREHAALIWDSIPGFGAVYGLIATVLIVFVSKFLGVGLMKREDYYD